MICFGAKTDQEEENGICGSHIKNNNNKKKKSKSNGHSRSFDFFFIFFIFLFLLSSIYGNRTVRIRRGKKQSALLNKGTLGNQKHELSPSF